MSAFRAPLVRGVDIAPEYFIEGLHDIRFHGVNTLFIPFRTVHGPKGAYRVAPFTCRAATGSLAVIERQIFEFAREHQLLTRWNHDATR